MKTTETRIKTEIAQKLEINPEVIDVRASLKDLGADALDEVEILMGIEAEFDIEIEDERFESCNTVGAIVALVESILKRK